MFAKRSGSAPKTSRRRGQRADTHGNHNSCRGETLSKSLPGRVAGGLLSIKTFVSEWVLGKAAMGLAVAMLVIALKAVTGIGAGHSARK